MRKALIALTLLLALAALAPNTFAAEAPAAGPALAASPTAPNLASPARLPIAARCGLYPLAHGATGPGHAESFDSL